MPARHRHGTHNYTVGTVREPNPVEPAEVVAMAVRPHGATAATDWITTHSGHPDFVATYDSVGNEPDKQWMTIDDNPASPHYNRVYAMWVDFHTLTPVPYVSYADALPGGKHTDWSAPQRLPEPPHIPQGATYLLPHVTPDGTIYTTVTNFNPKKGFCCASVFVDKSTDGGKTWSVAGTAVGEAEVNRTLHLRVNARLLERLLEQADRLGEAVLVVVDLAKQPENIRPLWTGRRMTKHRLEYHSRLAKLAGMELVFGHLNAPPPMFRTLLRRSQGAGVLGKFGCNLGCASPPRVLGCRGPKCTAVEVTEWLLARRGTLWSWRSCT